MVLKIIATQYIGGNIFKFFGSCIQVELKRSKCLLLDNFLASKFELYI